MLKNEEIDWDEVIYQEQLESTTTCRVVKGDDNKFYLDFYTIEPETALNIGNSMVVVDNGKGSD
jgi:hypothetical protein